MLPKYRSSVWPVMPEILDMLRNADWPRIPEIKSKVDVKFGAINSIPGGEAVVLHGSTKRATQTVETAGTPGKNDDVDATLAVFVNIPGFSAERTWGRLAELANAVDMTFRDLNTGKPILSKGMEDAGVWWLWASAIETEVVPMDGNAGSAGWLGMCMFTLTWRARI